MKPHFPLATLLFVASSTLAAELTLQDVEQAFRQKVLSLYSQEIGLNGLQAKIEVFSRDTFGKHPEVVREGVRRRITSLPKFPESNLGSYLLRGSMEQVLFDSSDAGARFVWLGFGWDPEKLGKLAKESFLSQQLKTSELAQRALINEYVTDRIYHFRRGESYALVVESLDELFVVGVHLNDVGLLAISNVSWMKRKPDH